MDTKETKDIFVNISRFLPEDVKEQVNSASVMEYKLVSNPPNAVRLDLQLTLEDKGE